MCHAFSITIETSLLTRNISRYKKEFLLETLHLKLDQIFVSVLDSNIIFYFLFSLGASRAVGTAMSNNPLSILVPCHRVIKSDGRPGNYGKSTRNEIKQWLLDFEGVMLWWSKFVWVASIQSYHPKWYCLIKKINHSNSRWKVDAVFDFLFDVTHKSIFFPLFCNVICCVLL